MAEGSGWKCVNGGACWGVFGLRGSHGDRWRRARNSGVPRFGTGEFSVPRVGIVRPLFFSCGKFEVAFRGSELHAVTGVRVAGRAGGVKLEALCFCRNISDLGVRWLHRVGEEISLNMGTMASADFQVGLDERGLLVSCGECGKRNRLSYERLGQTFRCGGCHSEMELPG